MFYWHVSMGHKLEGMELLMLAISVSRFGIEAVTLEGFEKKGKGSPALYFQMGR